MFHFDDEEILYVPQDGDEYVQLQTSPDGTPGARVNLNAVTYYARLGMKPKGIHALVGTTAMTIFNNTKLREAYENGKAYHQAWLRASMMAQVPKNGFLGDALLSRSAGKAEADSIEGEAPVLQNNEAPKIEFVVSDNTGDPEVDALRQLLEDRVSDAEAKARK